MSKFITIKETMKKYGDFTVIPNLSLEIPAGEFFTLLGPSGCGKTTLLRMIAGFVSIERGSIYFDDKIINKVPPKDRKIGMVFQDYALFPHLTVEKNIGFGLKTRKTYQADEIAGVVDDILDVIQMKDHRDKLPEKLSGGQQQRVALARAIVSRPDVLLMDEPLSNLDAKLRVDMRNVIRDIQKQYGVTTVYVTHDQEEAMVVSDRIAVMNHGVIQQIGVPEEIYQRPANLFVASFIGQTNILTGKLAKKDGNLILELTENYAEAIADNLKISLDEGQQIPVSVSVRPEEFHLRTDGVGIKAKIRDRMYLGLNTHYVATLETGQEVKLIRESDALDPLLPGTEICLGVKKDRINLFHHEKETSFNQEYKSEARLEREVG